jgi:hypothetical protein
LGAEGLGLQSDGGCFQRVRTRQVKPLSQIRRPSVRTQAHLTLLWFSYRAVSPTEVRMGPVRRTPTVMRKPPTQHATGQPRRALNTAQRLLCPVVDQIGRYRRRVRCARGAISGGWRHRPIDIALTVFVGYRLGPADARLRGEVEAAIRQTRLGSASVRSERSRGHRHRVRAFTASVRAAPGPRRLASFTARTWWPAWRTSW